MAKKLREWREQDTQRQAEEVARQKEVDEVRSILQAAVIRYWMGYYTFDEGLMWIKRRLEGRYGRVQEDRPQVHGGLDKAA